ncbi:MAG: pyridoxal phosphate-dependent aminotransferase [Gemmatimonadota bacterium]
MRRSGPAYPNLAGVEESGTLAMTARAAVLAARGTPVISLAAGEPDFPTPPYIIEATIRAIREGATRYLPAAGLPALRAAIAEHLAATYGARYGSEAVVVTAGAKQALFNAIFALFGPGDRVVIPAPYWVTYPALVRLARAEPDVVRTAAASGYKLTPEALDAALAAGASGVILNSPGNPTGGVYGDAELDALVEVAERHQAWIIADEVYDEIRYVDRFASLATRAAAYERCVVVSGFSKAYAMTGWRVGFAAAPEDLAAAMTTLQGHVTTSAASPSQHAALAALADQPARRAALDAMRAAFARRRRLVLDGLLTVPGLTATAPDGAFYVWIDLRGWGAAAAGDSAALCAELLERERLALVPGVAFGEEGFMRLSFAASEERLGAGIDRLRAAARRLGVAA